MALHSSTLAWRIPWTEEPGRLQSMGSQRVRHDWATSLSLSLSCIGEGNGNPLQCSCLENPRDGGAWWAAFSGVAQSRTRLQRLSSSSSVILEWYLGLPHVWVFCAPPIIAPGSEQCWLDLEATGGHFIVFISAMKERFCHHDPNTKSLDWEGYGDLFLHFFNKDAA